MPPYRGIGQTRETCSHALHGCSAHSPLYTRVRAHLAGNVQQVGMCSSASAYVQCAGLVHADDIAGVCVRVRATRARAGASAVGLGVRLPVRLVLWVRYYGVSAKKSIFFLVNLFLLLEPNGNIRTNIII